MQRTIYDEEIWPYILDKYPDLKELVTKLNLQDNPKKLQEIYGKAIVTAGNSSEEEFKLRCLLFSIEFVEQGLLEMAAIKGTFAHSVGEDGDAWATFELILDDFERSFNDFVKLCETKGIDTQHISFKTAYEVFLETIYLKIKYKVPYTKLFVRYLLKMSSQKERDSKEIKSYFLEYDKDMLKNISDELLLMN